MAAKSLTLRRADRCALCAADLPAGTRAWWDRDTRSVTCIGCASTPPPGEDHPAIGELDRGRPGGSVGREYERRRANRDRRAREAHPRIGGLLLALQTPPQHLVAFKRGEQGEKAVAVSLEARTADGPVVILHNRRMPGGRGDIDHIAVAPSGMFVIDSKDLRGSVRVDRPWFGQPRVLIGGRDRTKLIDGLDRQVCAVRAALDRTGHPTMDVRGVLCFTRADLPLIGVLQIRGHLLLNRKALATRLNADGPHGQQAIQATARALANALPAA